MLRKITWGILFCCATFGAATAQQLPDTQSMTLQGDIAAQMVAGIDRFLLRKIEATRETRSLFWNRDFSSPDAYTKSIRPNREALSKMIGANGPRVPFDDLQLISTRSQPALVGRGNNYEVFAVKWPVVGNIFAEGLLIEPADGQIKANVVAWPDADLLPEQIVGLIEGVDPQSQFARHLAESGFRVVVPTLVDRSRGKFTWGPDKRPEFTNREFLYRSAFELGQSLIGYEVQKALSAVDWFRKSAPETPVGVIGWGEGGLLALYSAAIDERIDACCVSGYFDNRGNLWQEPIDRNLFGLLNQFGDAELATMIAPRKLVIESCKAPDFQYNGQGGGAPARIVTPQLSDAQAEVTRALESTSSLRSKEWLQQVVSEKGFGLFATQEAVESFAKCLVPAAKYSTTQSVPPTNLRTDFDATARLRRTMRQIDQHNQALLRDCHLARKKLVWDRLNTDSESAYLKSLSALREYFRNDVIGNFKQPLLPANPRSRVFAEAKTHTTFEVQLDVFPDVFAYGLLLIPNGIPAGEKRPVVVCQHGLEGTPESTIGDQDEHYYARFATQLAERGFIVFAPQNIYRGQDRFRTLQRKANIIKKTLFSIMVPQHQQIVNWLQTLPMVDGDRIAFYGLSYGGKSAMRIPPLVTDYCLSICSADFNEWVDKNASTHNPRSYVWTGEYEIFEFDLGHTFNYAEMAALIAPRPFMVERGHYDGVADDWTVGWEFAKVRHLYQGRLKMADRCEIEWFDGPHKINGKGTFDFLQRHLRFPKTISESTSTDE